MSQPIGPDDQVARIADLSRRLALLERTVQPIPASAVQGGTVGAGSFTFPARTYFADGLELAHPASTPYIDWHRSANPAEATDYNVRLINDAADTLTLRAAAGDEWASLRSGRFRIGAYGWNPVWAHFGNRDRMDANPGAYAFMHGTDGSTLVNSDGGEGVCLRWAGGNAFRILPTGYNISDRRLDVTGDLNVSAETYSDGWFRSRVSGRGWYHQVHAGGFYMQDGYIRTYGGREFYCDNRVWGANAFLHHWQGDSGHAIVGHGTAGNGKGYMTRNDGAMWCMFNSFVTFRGPGGGDYVYIHDYGDVRMNVPTVAPGDPDLRIAGSNQLLRNASQRQYKTNIVDLERDANPVWKLRPRRYHWKDDAREDGARFNARHPRGCPGFIAEEMGEAAMDIVDLDQDGAPLAPATWPMFAYIITGLQELGDRVETLEGRLVNETTGGL